MRRQPSDGVARRGALAGVLLALSGCGFRPLYGTNVSGNSPARRQLGLIDVAIIPDRTGQLLRQALQQRLTSTTDALAKQYQLSVSFGIAVEGIGIQQDATFTRLRQSATATWSLRRLDPANSLVTNGTARALDGVNVIDQQYFELDLASEAIQRRLAETVADQITQQLASYFIRQPPAG